MSRVYGEGVYGSGPYGGIRSVAPGTFAPKIWDAIQNNMNSVWEGTAAIYDDHLILHEGESVENFSVYDLTNSEISFAITPASSGLTVFSFSIFPPSAEWSVDAVLDVDTIKFSMFDGTTRTPAFESLFDPVADVFWRVSERNKIIYFDTSPDGIKWTSKGEIEMGLDASVIYCSMHYDTSVTSGRVTQINTAAGGTNGEIVTLTLTGGASGNPFTSIIAHSGGEVRFDNTHGRMAYKFSTVLNGPAQLDRIVWQEVPARQCSGMFEIYLDSYSDPSVDDIELGHIHRSGGGDLYFYVGTSGDLNVGEFGGFAVSPDGTIPLNQWVRVEYAFKFDTAGGTYPDYTGPYMVAVYPDRTTTTPSWLASGTRTWFNPSAGPAGGMYTGVQFGNAGNETIHHFMGTSTTNGLYGLPGPYIAPALTVSKMNWAHHVTDAPNVEPSRVL